jgi:hypothetical protein
MGKAAALEGLSERIRPLALAKDQRLPVLPALETLLPQGSLQRGTTVAIAAAPGVGGTTSLALALVAEASRSGAWLAAVGLPSLGLVAADEAGLALERLVLVAAPERSAWGGVVAALVDGFDLLLLHAGRTGVRQADARRLVARARERGSVLVQLGSGWGGEADVALRVTEARWEGPEAGYGHLRARRVVVEAGGRRAARPRAVELWLPAPDAVVAPAPARPEPSRPAVPARRERPLRAVG